MKRLLSYLTVFSLLVRCTFKSNGQFEEILNENFLNFVDTVAYKHHSFFIIPNDTIYLKYRKLTDYTICIDKKLGDSRRLQNYLEQELNKFPKDEYLSMLKSKLNPISKQINLDKIKLIGKYTFTDIEKCESNNTIKSVGTIRFFEPLINDNYAIVFLSMQSTPKAGVINSFLLKKINEKWKIENKIELERW